MRRSPIEHWLPVAEVDGWYDVSDLGNVRRVATAPRAVVHRVLKPKVTKFGYLIVTLSVRRKRIHRFVHRLVAVAFIGPPTGKRRYVNHIDGDKLNNWNANLEWVTASENMAHAYAMGLVHGHTARGVDSYRTALTEADIRAIRDARGLVLQRELADQFGIGSRTISKIQTGKLWGHLN